TIILGAIGSGVWDSLAKPGLSRFGRIILNTVTLGSESARDSAYSSAALDPTPIAPLLIILILSFIPLVIAIFVALIEFIFRNIFFANMNICAPYMSEFEEKRFRARFSSVNTKADYQVIDHELRELAAKNGVSLLDYSLW